MMIKVAPSILSADFAYLADEIKKLKLPALTGYTSMLWTASLYLT